MSEANDKKQGYANKKGSQKGASSRRVSATNGAVADWGSASPALLVDAVQQVARQGGAIRFSYTSDGGAFCIGILGDGDPYNDYVKPSEDIDEYLRALAERWR